MLERFHNLVFLVVFVVFEFLLVNHQLFHDCLFEARERKEISNLGVMKFMNYSGRGFAS